ncbi:hypothetical protein DITRI_Ditri09bG0036000 [Diplodiscus trichospermus]
MTTLQRSSVSFRRQGSSGLIWNDRHIIDPKTGLPSAAAAGDQRRHDQENFPAGNRSPEEFFSPQQDDQIHRPQPTIFQAHHEPENNVLQHPKLAEGNNGSAQKAHQRCGISAIFGRCMGPTS